MACIVRDWKLSICLLLFPLVATRPTSFCFYQRCRSASPRSGLWSVICRPFTQWLHHTMIGNMSLMSDFSSAPPHSPSCLCSTVHVKNRTNAYRRTLPSTSVATHRNDEVRLSSHVIGHVRFLQWSWEGIVGPRDYIAVVIETVWLRCHRSDACEDHTVHCRRQSISCCSPSSVEQSFVARHCFPVLLLLSS